MRKWFLCLLALGLCGCGSDTGANLTSAAESFQLNVLHYNDSNSALVSSDDFGGVARFATVLKREQGRRPSLTMAGGNHLGAGAQFQASREHGIPFFEAVALQELGVQASAVGPGEFYYGPANFAQFLQGVTLPFVAANLDYSAQPELVGNPRRTTLRLLGREVCVVGVSTPSLAFTSTPGNVVVQDQLAALTQAEIDQAEQNVVIVLANLDNLQAARALARQLRGVDLVVASSRSEILANAGQRLVPGDVVSGAYPVLEQGLDGHTVPIVSTGGDFHYLGRVGVILDAQGDDQGTVLVPGTRVRTLTLAGNIPLVVGGQVVPGAPAVSVATLDFLARGGDQAPFRGRAFTALGQDYEQTARQFLTLALHGQILSASYPAAGLGRITRL